ncbi:MAG: hypothetical protein LAT75_02810 [Candidatus Cyclonatronum sp.]|uniref:hypothetical protein n=1 Tax=Cyclonatronum sp. TaxID=3024185 RepID=UPI0025B8700D|nr:hypothetical protein [Cyclonatronum sp.]MCH8485767.1 hypothetical protein [Cyclonatronum sp.]
MDELILECRDQKARNYIKEAVACYNSGAFRASIVATWIAVAYDLLEKIRELSLTGDQEAEKQAEFFEKACQSGDISAALRIEKELLTLARDKFELISIIEFTDLKRLQDDRNRCAHPSMVSTEESYSPSAELARYHICNAVECLLKHQPVQGKSALARLLKEVDSEYFPNNTVDAISHFNHGPLSKPRKSLVRNFIIVLLKKMIFNDLNYKEMVRYGSALNAIRNLHREITEATCQEKVSELIRALDDGNLNRAVAFLKNVHDIWPLIDKNIQDTIKRYVRNMPSKDLYGLTDLIKIAELKKMVFERINKLTKHEAFNDLLFDNHPSINSRRIQIYIKSANYEFANNVAEDFRMYVSDLTKEQTQKLIEGSSTNSQVIDSYEFPSIVSSLRNNKNIDKTELNNLLSDHNLDKYVID